MISRSPDLLFNRDADAPRALYARLLGSSWLQLAEPVRFVHSRETTARAHGRLRIQHGRSLAARILARLLRLPRPADAAETRLVVTSHAGGERWLRTFADRRLDTRQYRAGRPGAGGPGAGGPETGEGELAERIGLLEFRFRLEASQGSLVFRQVGAALLLGSLRLRLPAASAPRVDAREDPAGARQIRIHVRVALPAVGALLTYEGTMNIEDTGA